MDWKQELFKRLDALGEKLGTTAAYLWHVLVRQGIVEGTMAAVYTIIGVIAFFIFLRIFKSAWKEGKEEEHNWDETLIARVWVSALGMIVAAAFSLTWLYSAITLGLNPEFYALQQILGK